MDIGVIGLGHMGAAMARSLLRAGHTVTVYNRTPSKAEPLLELGASFAAAPADACHGDAVITMLSDDHAVRALLCAPHGLLDVLAPMKTVHISASTISPSLVRDLAERHAERNEQFVSAPVLGRPDVAEAGKLTVLAAGDTDVVDAVRPAFEAYGQRTFLVGNAPEAANVVKLACNTLIASMIEAVGEALALIAKSGLVAPKTFLDVLQSTMLSSSTFRPYIEHLRDHELMPGFAMPLALKDIELTLATAHDVAVPLPLASLIRDHMLEAIATGHGDEDWAALALVPQEAAGIGA
jgi:3-hydroxyisobutyrate dehydrogenase-like beta-hydroxyacid dehydrogenase